MARLLYRDSQGREGTVELSPAETVFVGRGIECAIRSDDGMVSRRHSQVKMENGRFVVEDLNSANGVFLNNVRVQKSALGHADIVQCGSLMIRFLDEATPSAPPPKKLGGTMVLEAAERPSPRHGNLPFGGPPAMPGAVEEPRTSPAPALPFGGPPPMPGDLVIGTPPPPPAAAARPAIVPSRAASPRPASALERADSVELDGGNDPTRLAAQLVELRDELDALAARYELEVAEHKRARADVATQRERAEAVEAELRDRDDRLRAEAEVAAELRDELAELRGELTRAGAEHDELAEQVAARDRAASRAGDEGAKLREALGERDRKLAELSRGRDDTQRELGDLQAELARLREVVAEQERMLEDRRLGTVARDEVIKKLRTARVDTQIGEAAREIHDAINDLLSELRNHGVVVRHEVDHLDGDPARVTAVRDAATALVEVAETAKRGLRRLRELADDATRSPREAARKP